MARTFLFFIIFIAVFVGFCFLQVRLSRKPRWTAGLILPCAHILLSILIMVVSLIFSMVGFTMTGGSAVIETGDYIVTVYDNGAVKVVHADTGEEVTGTYSDNGNLYVEETGEFIVSDSDVFTVLNSLTASEHDTSNDEVINIGIMLIMFIFFNIPTIVYLIIYFVVRQGKRNVDQLDKIEIQNL